MSRTYYIEQNSVIVSTPDGGAEVAEPGTTQVVHGHKIHYVKACGEVVLVQILGKSDEVLYSSPAHNVRFVWCPTAPEPEIGKTLTLLREVT